jgi:glycosyltransferase involved in cell wall biosynthesis
MLSVGNRKPHKNLVMGPEVLSRIPELRWIVVGEQFRGWDEVPRRATELGVADRIVVLDPQPDSILHSLYAAAGCLFFPSRHEGFGLPVLESLAAGSPVVAGSAGATLEVLAGHGIACPPGDGDAFAEAVRKMVFGPRPDPAPGRAHAATFTWARAAERLAAVLDEF